MPSPAGQVTTTQGTLFGSPAFRQAAEQQLLNTVQGQGFQGPLLQQAQLQANLAAAPVLSGFQQAGRFHSGLAPTETANAIGNQFANLANAERNREIQAASLGGALQQQTTTDQPYFDNQLAEILGLLTAGGGVLNSLFGGGGGQGGGGGVLSQLLGPTASGIGNQLANFLGFGGSAASAAPGIGGNIGVQLGGIGPAVAPAGAGGATFGTGAGAGGIANPGISAALGGGGNPLLGPGGGAFGEGAAANAAGAQVSGQAAGEGFAGAGAGATGLLGGTGTGGAFTGGIAAEGAFTGAAPPFSGLSGASAALPFAIPAGILALSQIGAGPKFSLENAKQQINNDTTQTFGREGGGRTGDNQPRTVAWNDPQLSHSALADALSQTSAPNLWNELSESGRQNLAKTLKRPDVPAGVFPTNIWRGSLGEGKAAQNSGLGEGRKFWQAQWSDGQTSSGRSDAFAAKLASSGFPGPLSAEELRRQRSSDRGGGDR